MGSIFEQIVPVLRGERILLYCFCVLGFGLLTVINILLHRAILRMPVTALMNGELVSVGMLGIYRALRTLVRLRPDLTNQSDHLAKYYRFTGAARYMVARQEEPPHAAARAYGLVLVQLLVLTIIAQQPLFDPLRQGFYDSWTQLQLPSPFYAESTPITEVNVVLVEESPLCIVVKQRGKPPISVLPVGVYAPFVWNPKSLPRVNDTIALGDVRPADPTISIAPAKCARSLCRTHLKVVLGENPVVLAYGSSTALPQLEVKAYLWYRVAVPRIQQNDLYYVELTERGIVPVTPDVLTSSVCE